MTSMLYTPNRMNKPNLPDEIWLGKKDYSWQSDLKVNGWLFVATLVSAASDIIFVSTVRQWSLALRVLIAVVPFIAILFWARSLARWVRGMDEMHRRITLAAILFTMSACFFVVMLWNRLDAAGVFPSRPGTSWNIGTIGHVFLLMTFFYFLGFRIFSRRFQ